MFDEITWQQELPDARLPAGTVFQTKSLGSGMNRLTLTPDGRLIEHIVRYTVAERDHGEATQCRSAMGAVPGGDVDTCFHGDIVIIALVNERRAIEYLARFTHGTLEWVKALEASTAGQKTNLK